ncbi:hypothetical protein [Sporisorium scitamineum]|uniref:pectin lyase n=1 Tax=Sporisorium scitamineum TaxID=49012 RepID=A0A0F7SAI4_9BASI|nr:hypothetical protein [Sporisorium scitamineum]
MRLLFMWPFGPPLLLLALSLFGLASAEVVQMTQADRPKYLNYDILLHKFYKPETDEICFHNGLRYTNCSPDGGSLVNIDVFTREQLRELVLAKHGGEGTIQLLVYVLLINLERSQYVTGSPTPGHESPDELKAKAQDAIVGRAKKFPGGIGGGLEMKVSDFDPNVDGPAAAKKLGAPPVDSTEDSCYLVWLKSRHYDQGAINTVLNELYVRHVAITQGDKKVWDMESPTGCYSHKAVAPGPLVPKLRILDPPPPKPEANEALAVSYTKHLNPRSVQDGEVDDMKVFHPVMQTHLDDPWKKDGEFQQEKVLTPGEFVHRKRSMGKGWVGGHRHVKREGADNTNQQPYTPTSPFDDDPAYRNGLPTAPVELGDAGSGSAEAGTGGSAITSKPHGFAAGVTGGGSATPVIPKNIHELTKLLTDPQPQVIHLDKVYDFRGSEGVCTDCAGCIPDSYAKCPDKGQLAIDNGQGWCSGKPPKKVTYDKAGLTPIRVASNKSVIGITANAAMRGKGLRIAHHKNIILHNFRIDEINPSQIWSGDGITIYDSDLVWIDKITFSMIGRQFIVTGYEAAGRLTISNCLFDCYTKWSSTCDDSHYWTVLGYGKSDKVTFSGNLMQHCSGRSPRIANPDNERGDSVWHVVNNVFDRNTGHSLDMGPGISALIEGNVFTDVAQTSLHEASPGRAFAPSDKGVCDQCKGPLGRECQPNAYKNAQPVPSTTSPAEVLKDVAPEKMGGALPPGQVVAKVGQTAGCAGGKGVADGDVGGSGQGAAGDGAQQEGYADGTQQEGYGNGAAQVPGGNAAPGTGAGAGSGSGSGPGVSQPGAGAGAGSGTGAYIPGIGFGGSSSSAPDPNKPALPGAKIGGPAFGSNDKEVQPERYGAAPQQPISDDEQKRQQKLSKFAIKRFSRLFVD